MSDNPDLSLLVRAVKQSTTDVASLKDDLMVLTAIAMRQGGTLAALLTEVRAMHSQHNRLTSRTRELETGTTGMPS